MDIAWMEEPAEQSLDCEDDLFLYCFEIGVKCVVTV